MTKRYKAEAKQEVINFSNHENFTNKKLKSSTAALCDSFNKAIKLGISDSQKSLITEAMIDTACYIAKRFKRSKIGIKPINKIANTVFSKVDASLIPTSAKKKIEKTAINLTLNGNRNSNTFDTIETLQTISSRLY